MTRAAGRDPEIRRALLVSMLVMGGLALAAGLTTLVIWWSRPDPTVVGSMLPPAVPRGESDAIDVAWHRTFRREAVEFSHLNGATGRKLLPETLGGGVAIADLDGDGDPDLAFVDGDGWGGGVAPDSRGRGLVVLLNDGAGRFETPADATGLESPRQGMGLAVGDVDGDRDLDLLATGVAGVRLFENATDESGLRFRDVTAASGLDALEGWSTAAGFGDLDGDGDLDLVVAHYVEWSPEIDEAVDYRLAGLGRAYGPPLGFAGETVRVFFNDGRGRFEDRTEAAGLDVRNPSTGEPMAKALGLLVEDLDGDGDLDLFVANDTVANFLFLNRGDGTFDEVAAAAGTAFDRSGAATGAMGVDAAYDAEGGVAIAVGNFATEPSSLYRSEPGSNGVLRFADQAIVEGLSAPTRPALTFGMLWADLDGDGTEELIAANGHLEDRIEALQPSQRYRQSAQVFTRRDGNSGRLIPVDASAIGDLATPIVGRGLAAGDLDLDGDLDLVLTQIAGPPLVLFNDRANAAPPNRWVRLVLEGPRGDASTVGAVVQIDAGGRRFVRRVAPTRSYLSQCERPLTVGLGDADRIERLEVRWTGGGRTLLEDLAVDRTIRIGGDEVVPEEGG